MNISKPEYQSLTEQKSPNSPLIKNILWAFCVGGLICVLGQAISEYAGTFGLSGKSRGAIVSISLIFLSALLTGLKVFDNIAKHAGAGTIVPITGFANSIAAPAMEFKSEGLVLGMGAKMFVVAGPVLAYGITTSVLYGIVLYILGVI